MLFQRIGDLEAWKFKKKKTIDIWEEWRLMKVLSNTSDIYYFEIFSKYTNKGLILFEG